MKEPMTQEKFSQLVAQNVKRQAVEKALEANDYTAFVQATTPTQAEFTAMAAKHKTQKAVQAAFQAKDYDAYVLAVQGTDQEGKLTKEQFLNKAEKKTNGMGQKKHGRGMR
jgi:hypothetical protein